MNARTQINWAFFSSSKYRKSRTTDLAKYFATTYTHDMQYLDYFFTKYWLWTYV